MRFYLFGPSKEEVEVLVDDLTLRYGDEAYDSALRLCDAWRMLGAKRHEKLCRLAARKLEVTETRMRGLTSAT